MPPRKPSTNTRAQFIDPKPEKPLALLSVPRLIITRKLKIAWVEAQKNCYAVVEQAFHSDLDTSQNHTLFSQYRIGKPSHSLWGLLSGPC